MKIINLFGSPCSGKTTTALGLAHKMKLNGYNVEYIPEYARQIIYKEQFNILENHQIKIIADVDENLKNLDGKVDYVIMDSPLILSLIYAKDDYYVNFNNLVLEIFNSFDNINIYLERNFDYVQDKGRLHNEEQSDKIHNKLLKLLKEKNIEHTIFSTDFKTSEKLFKYLKNNKII